MQRAYELFKENFKHQSFRDKQEDVIRRLLVDNKSALVIFPTGGSGMVSLECTILSTLWTGGKSLTYQLPALCFEVGLTLVVSPLLSLIKDQVDVLRECGINAANLDSTLRRTDLSKVREGVRSGEIKILYVAPERLNNEGFIQLMDEVVISLLAVDEAHCISQWGNTFRPDYLKISRFAKQHNVERVLCLTATATPEAANDICDVFDIDRTFGVFRLPVYRKNLHLHVVAAESLNDKIAYLVPLLQGRKGPSIVYVTRQKDTEIVQKRLESYEIDADIYHAGLENAERARVQDHFMKSSDGIVICTIAFGMGIDKANIRQIIHLALPKTLEDYSQQVGRAGRDGHPSDCIMFLSSLDVTVLQGFVRGDTPAKEDVESWLKEVLSAQPDEDNIIEFSHYRQADEHDINRTVLAVNYAWLELEYGYIHILTPYFTMYQISPRGTGMDSIQRDTSNAAKAIRSHWRHMTRAREDKYEIDIVAVAQATGIHKLEISKRINAWEIRGFVDCKASQIRARYEVMEKDMFPVPQEKINEVVNKFYSRMAKNERGGIAALHEVIDFATGNACLAYTLAKHFGDEDAVENQRCEKCTFCTTGQLLGQHHRRAMPVDLGNVRAILAAYPLRHRPLMLARMAYGIRSPRITKLRWEKQHPSLWGSMGDADFDQLLAAFDQQCRIDGYEPRELPDLPSTPSPKKRTSSQALFPDSPSPIKALKFSPQQTR